jgi:hypothetical protein
VGGLAAEITDEGALAALNDELPDLQLWEFLLYQWPPEVDDTTTAADLWEVDFPGYARQTTRWTAPILAGPSLAATRAGTLTWIRAAGTGAPVTVFGWAAVGPGLPQSLRAVQPLPAPVVLTNPGDNVTLCPLELLLGLCAAQTRFVHLGHLGAGVVPGGPYRGAAVQVGHLGGGLSAPFPQHPVAHLLGHLAAGARPTSPQRSPVHLVGHLAAGARGTSPQRGTGRLTGHLAAGGRGTSPQVHRFKRAGQAGGGSGPASGQKAIQYVVLDSFAGTGGTLLVDHAPNLGGPWINGAAGVQLTGSNSAGAGSAVYCWDVIAGLGGDFWYTVQYVRRTETSPAIVYWRLSDPNNFYEVQLYSTFWYFYKIVGGSVANSASGSLSETPGGVYAFTVECSGNTYTLVYQGLVIYTFTDAFNAGQPYVGIGFNPVDANQSPIVESVQVSKPPFILTAVPV